MSSHRSFFFLDFLRIVAILSLTSLSYPSLAQQPAPSSLHSTAYNVIFEDERINMMQMRLKPGEKITMQSYPDHVVYITGPGKIRFGCSKGPPMDSETKIGEVYWGPAGKHTTENIGKTEINAIVVELKSVSANKGSKATKLLTPPICPSS
jgi:hypothetical protein